MTSAMSVEPFAAFGDLSEGETRALQRLAGASVRLSAGCDVRAEWGLRQGLFFLHEGWVLSSVDLPDGGRQILKIHLPGDIMGAPGLAFDAPVETLATLTAAQVSPIPLPALGELFATAPRLGALLFLFAQEERVILMDRLTAVGRMDAEHSVAALLAHLHDRLTRHRPAAEVAVVRLPMTQLQIADALGLTSVHVSRVMRRLEKAGWVRRAGRMLELVDAARLREAVALPRRTLQRDPAWLPARV